MAAYNFQKQFVPLIESGAKCSTIRKRRKNGYLPRQGEVLRLYAGMRTKACRLLREAAVTGVTPIVVNACLGYAAVILNGSRLSDAAVELMAKGDGFSGIRDFADFFEEKYGPELQAYLITWASPPDDIVESGK